jgi:hypothetical protein
MSEKAGSGTDHQTAFNKTVNNNPSTLLKTNTKTGVKLKFKRR